MLITSLIEMAKYFQLLKLNSISFIKFFSSLKLIDRMYGCQTLFSIIPIWGNQLWKKNATKSIKMSIEYLSLCDVAYLNLNCLASHRLSSFFVLLVKSPYSNIMFFFLLSHNNHHQHADKAIEC